MESIYYVLCWHCHRRCKHCYESRFRPYVREELEAVLTEAERNAPRIIAHFPERMTYLDQSEPDASAPGGDREKVGRIILSGGDVLTEPVRERVLYPTLVRLRQRYAPVGGVNLVVQTTGDLLTEQIVAELLERGVWMISVAGFDDFHVGMEGAKREALWQKLLAIFANAGMRASGLDAGRRRWTDEEGPVYNAFGATEDAWIGKIWPRGRAWENDLSRATLEDNFCGAWSGGLGFLRAGRSGSEVSVEPSGDVYPCCMKTALPLGNLTEEPLIEILESLADHPVYQAINEGRPQRMGLSHGWAEADFLAASHTKTPSGREYANLCIGCDRFHEAVLGPVIAELRQRRRAAREAVRRS